ncbi:hypothetical protein C0J52_12309 [Blattella germanica]|nr:hypothetical protein C0J52_12309 [Blattella germanica]
MAWLTIESLKAVADGRINDPVLPTTASGCGFNDSLSIANEHMETEDEVFILYKISFSYYSLMGFILVFIVGLPISLVTKSPKLEEMRTDLFTPIVRKYVIKKARMYKSCTSS